MTADSDFEWDFIIIGSGFGGSVSALRLVEKGYRVLVLEKGRRLGPSDFPKTNWDLRRWFWNPALGWRGLFKMTFFRHLTVVSGVGVGGGSLVYANTLPIPKDAFFASEPWAKLADWSSELRPHYATARRMLGAAPNPRRTLADDVLRDVSRDLGKEDSYQSTTVGVYFGEPGVTVPDPYFGGEGPERTGCNSCGGCMLGCRFGAKNTLDKNYLWLAEKRGLQVMPDSEATFVRPLAGGGYQVEFRQGTSVFPFLRHRRHYTARNVIFSGGVLGTVQLLLKLKEREDGLPKLSPRLGDYVRTNAESLIGVVSSRPEKDFSQGVAIGSILETGADSHLEAVRYNSGSGFFRLMALPHAPGRTFVERVARTISGLLRHPLRVFRVLMVKDWAKSTMILLYMRTMEGHLRLTRKRKLLRAGAKGLATSLAEGPPPAAFMPEATALAERVAEKVDGVPMSMLTETILGAPTTAHILGGCCMGDSPQTGVIDLQHRVFGYPGLYVIDGSAISANPGVNPSLTITALAERAMSFIPARAELEAPKLPPSTTSRVIGEPLFEPG